MLIRASGWGTDLRRAGRGHRGRLALPGSRRRRDAGLPRTRVSLVELAPPDLQNGAMTIDLGLPALPPPTLAPRRKTRKIKVGKVDVGGDAPISVQSMTTTLTSDINATLQQIAELTATGCDIVRVAVPSQDDADALPAIAHKSQIPVIADIHFQPKYVFAAIDAGCAAVRVNPGNIRAFDDQVKEIARAAGDRGTSIRIGVNAGSLDKRLLAKYGKATPGGAGRVGAVGGEPVRGARLPRLQDQRQAQRPGGHGPRVRAAQRGLRLPAAPRRDRGRPGVPGHDQVRRRLRLAAQPGHRRHHPGLALGAAGRGGQGRAADPASRSTCAPASSRSSPARPAAGPRSTSTSWPRRSPPGSRA